MSGRLDGKVAMITGGVSGIGLGTVELFVAEGCRVVVADLLEDEGRALEDRFAGQVRFVRCDVTKEADIARAVGTAPEAFGGLDVLFNNAGASDMVFDVESIDAEKWDWMFALLVRAPALGMKYAAPLIAARGGGSVINTASVAGLQAGFGTLPYSSAKAALIHLSRVAAASLAPKRIRVNAICPGFIATPITGTSQGLSREASKQMAAQLVEVGVDLQPLPRAGVPQDIAEAALFLASDASVFVTGTHLIVDGGLSTGPRNPWTTGESNPFEALAPAEG